MIDIHHHCIHGVDDGPRDLQEAADLCRMAADDGIETIVATPHVLRGPWQNTSRDVLEGKLEELRGAIGASPRLVLGSEYYFEHDMPEVLESGGGIVPLAGSRYVLVEFAAHAIPPLADAPLYRAQLGGWTPVIAHPERNTVFQARSEILSALVARGAKVQITAGSVVGDFGAEAQRACLRWLREGLVHFIASDSHNTRKRPPRMKAAIEALAGIVGPDTIDALVRRNPAAVVENRQLEWDPEPAPVERSGLLRRLWESLRT